MHLYWASASGSEDELRLLSTMHSCQLSYHAALKVRSSAKRRNPPVPTYHRRDTVKRSAIFVRASRRRGRTVLIGLFDRAWNGDYNGGLIVAVLMKI